MFRLRHMGLLLVLASVCAAAQPPVPVRLDTSFEEPYQVVVDGQLGGLSVKVLECIFNRMQQPYQIQLTSLQRARLNVSRQVADGFFSSAPNSLVDGYAVLSAPLLIEKWYWYALDPSLLNLPIWDKQLRIGSVLGSNSMIWLESRGIPVEQKVPRLEQLVEMLRHGRINMLLADSSAMHSTLQQIQDTQKLHQRFVRYSPLGVYFSKTFVDEHPDFLKAFNRQVESCAPASTELSQAEQTYLRQLATQHVTRWGLHADLLAALREAQQRDNSHERIQELDRQWRRERILEEKPLIRRTLNL
jgi:ABC-type amino acid transport substrate-binding protein